MTTSSQRMDELLKLRVNLIKNRTFCTDQLAGPIAIGPDGANLIGELRLTLKVLPNGRSMFSIRNKFQKVSSIVNAIIEVNDHKRERH
jgi:hypothetical protein